MPSTSPEPPAQIVFRLRIRLEDVDPPVWRRLLVPGSVRLAKLHDIFQAALGWTNSHLHAFTIGGQRYGMQFDEYPEGEIDEKDVTVRQALWDQRRFVYEYDFGDSWTHEVIVEETIRLPMGLKFAVCLDGENACPPEDCGGAPGYERMRQVLADPTDGEYDLYRRWAGESFDPAAFDLAGTNAPPSSGCADVSAISHRRCRPRRPGDEVPGGSGHEGLVVLVGATSESLDGGDHPGGGHPASRRSLTWASPQSKGRRNNDGLRQRGDPATPDVAAVADDELGPRHDHPLSLTSGPELKMNAIVCGARGELGSTPVHGHRSQRDRADSFTEPEQHRSAT
jgi:hypothetical protein